MRKLYSRTVILSLAVASLVGAVVKINAAATVSLKELASQTHFHGISVDAADPTRLYLATHHGFFLVTPDGMATRLSDNQNDYMGFTPHPSDLAVLYASGHPAGGGNTGFIESRDGGRTWNELSEGVAGPVDFHQMDVSRSDPKTIYGVFHGLQVSHDGGHTWELKAFQTPPELIDLAVSATKVDTLYAATKQGLLVREDGGQAWQPAHADRSPATLVQTAGDGSVYAFVWGLGLLRSPDDSLRWQFLSNAFGDQYLLHLAVDPTNPANLYAITSKVEILASHDGGLTWNALE